VALAASQTLVCIFTSVSGEMSNEGSTSLAGKPGDLVISPDGLHLYVVGVAASSITSGFISRFRYCLPIQVSALL
jgi:hypothetical protein